MLLLAGSAFGQNAYYDRGQSGFFFGGSVFSGDDYIGLGAGAAYTISGSFSLGVSVARATYDDDEYGDDFKETDIAPFVSALLLRPEESMPIGIEATATYSRATVSGDVLDAFGWDMSRNVLIGRGDIFAEIEALPTARILPFVGITYMFGNAEIEDSFGNSEEEDISEVGFTIGASFQLNKKFVIVPSMTNINDNTSFSISFNAVIPST
ncbi:MAG: hypothetical protein QF637_06530 [Acidimicrobiales bacterium]|nr:hypothetical protein [Acidimicrobiales bacterium]